MRRYSRRLLANLYYLKKPFLEFLPVLLGMIAIVLVGGALFQHYYEHPREGRLSFARALYVTYCLFFGEQAVDFPDHWILEVLFVLLPIVGLVFVLDAFVRFGGYILRRDELDKDWVSAMAKTMSNHVILCGLGKLGLRVLQELIRLGEQVVVVEKDPLCVNIAFARIHDVPVRIGTHRVENLLIECNIAEAKSIILATDDDLANLEFALDARKAKPGIRVVLRMFDQDLASKVREVFDINMAFSTSALSAPLFALGSSDQSILNSFYVGDRLLVVARLSVRGLAKQTIGGLGATQPIVVLSHRRGESAAFCPRADIELQTGDEITIQTEPPTLRQVHEWNR
jgi:Trk K+ transport system NAD-binding subunit